MIKYLCFLIVEPLPQVNGIKGTVSSSTKDHILYLNLGIYMVFSKNCVFHNSLQPLHIVYIAVRGLQSS